MKLKRQIKWETSTKTRLVWSKLDTIFMIYNVYLDFACKDFFIEKLDKEGQSYTQQKCITKQIII